MAPSPLKLLTSPFTDTRLTAPLLFLLAFCPSRLLKLIPPKYHKYILSPAAKKALGICLSLQLVKRTSEKLSDLAINNWYFKNAGFGKGEMEGKEVVLITGGASGIGELMALKFATKGIKVVVLDLKPPKEAFPENISFFTTDVTSETQVQEVAKKIRDEIGEVTVLINNAGIALINTILDEDMADVRKCFEVNAISHYILAQEFLPHMIEKNHGHIVTLASIASFGTGIQLVPYCATKAAAMSFHEGLSGELVHRYNAPNVRTTIIHPTWVRTPMTQPLYTSSYWKPPLLPASYVADAVVAQVLAGRSAKIILPESAARARLSRGFPLWYQWRIRGLREGVVGGSGGRG